MTSHQTVTNFTYDLYQIQISDTEVKFSIFHYQSPKLSNSRCYCLESTALDQVENDP